MPKSQSSSLCSSKRRNLSLQSKVSLSPALPSGIYNRNIDLPPGIRNGGNICYAISVLQCCLEMSLKKYVPFIRKNRAQTAFHAV